MTEATWLGDRAQRTTALSPIRVTADSPASIMYSGWRRWPEADCWVHGSTAITDEVIAAWPREQVQAYALEHAGEMLPAMAFPEPALPIVQVVDAARELGWINGA